MMDAGQGWARSKSPVVRMSFVRCYLKYGRYDLVAVTE